MRGCTTALIALLGLLLAAPALAQPETGATGTATGTAPAPAPAPEPALAPSAGPRAQIAVVRHRPLGPHPSIGPALAPVTIELFAKPDERFTAALHRHLVTLQQRHPRRVRIVYRLVAVGRSHDLAVATLEAFAQGQFRAFFDAVVARPEPPLTRDSIRALCREIGVDVAKVEAAWTHGRHDETLHANEGTRRRRTDATPSLLFNGRDLGRATSMNLDKLEAHYRATYEHARDTLARGVPLERLYDVLVREHAAEQLEKLPRELLGAVDDLSASELRDLDPTPRLMHQGIDVPGHVLGSASAPVTVHVYCRFLSANCAMLRSTLATVREEFPDEVRLVFHHMFSELPSVKDGHDAAAAATRRNLIAMHRASLCADEQGAFWDFYRLAYQPQVPQRRVIDVAEQINALLPALAVDAARFQACMARPGGDDAVLDRVRAARKAGIVHTPTVVIGGRAYLGFKSSLDLRALVEEELLPGLLEQAFPAADEGDARFSRDAQ